MKIYLGADHAGFKLKEQVKKYLTNSGYEILDLGAKKFIKNDDYPDYARKVAEHVRSARSSTTELPACAKATARQAKMAKLRNQKDVFGILFCGSGQGVSIAANKIKGIRAVAVSNSRDAKMTRQHNDANVLCLSGWELSFDKAKKIIATFLNTPFSKEKRHLRRLKKIQQLEKF